MFIADELSSWSGGSLRDKFNGSIDGCRLQNIVIYVGMNMLQKTMPSGHTVASVRTRTLTLISSVLDQEARAPLNVGLSKGAPGRGRCQPCRNVAVVLVDLKAAVKLQSFLSALVSYLAPSRLTAFSERIL